MCYFRSNKVQYAKRILSNWNQKNSNSTTSSNSSVGAGSATTSAFGFGGSGSMYGHNRYNSRYGHGSVGVGGNNMNNTLNGNINSHHYGIESHHINNNHNNHNTNNAIENLVICESIVYLLAKCNIELELWKDVEDILLKNARMRYMQYKKKYKEGKAKEKNNAANTTAANTTTGVDSNGIGSGVSVGGNGTSNSTIGGRKKNGINGTTTSSTETPTAATTTTAKPAMANTLEEYLTQLVSEIGKDSSTNFNPQKGDNHPNITNMSNSSDGFPIPNGAAGLHLLGVVFQRTMRKEKAAIYYQMALKVCVKNECLYFLFVCLYILFMCFAFLVF